MATLHFRKIVLDQRAAVQTLVQKCRRTNQATASISQHVSTTLVCAVCHLHQMVTSDTICSARSAVDVGRLSAIGASGAACSDSFAETAARTIALIVIPRGRASAAADRTDASGVFTLVG